MIDAGLSSAEVILWRAPSQSCLDPEKEITEGYDPQHYPDDGPYFSIDGKIAQEFSFCYARGLQEIHMAKTTFEELLSRGIIQGDMFYDPGICWHVPSSGLPVFNEALNKDRPITTTHPSKADRSAAGWAARR